MPLKKIYLIPLLFMLLLISSFTSNDDTILVKKSLFEVLYSQKMEQPLWLTYRSTNRPVVVNRAGIAFYTEKGIKTSDDNDYRSNEWDRGHLAPAATFSDNMENLKQTFSYLNCALQQKDLNRTEWKYLEEKEREWDNDEPLTVKVEIFFDSTSVKLKTGATIPAYFMKHIYFETNKKWKCFMFNNKKPELSWVDSEIICETH